MKWWLECIRWLWGYWFVSEILLWLVMMDIKLPFGWPDSGQGDTRRCFSLQCDSTVSSQWKKHYVQKAKTNGISAYLVKLFDAKSFDSNGRGLHWEGRQLQHVQWMVKLSKKIDRIVIEKAKGLLMARDHLSEPEAFKRIRTISNAKESADDWDC